MVGLIATEATLFVLAIAAYFYLRTQSRTGWPPAPLHDPEIAQAARSRISCSSLTCIPLVAASRAVNAGKRRAQPGPGSRSPTILGLGFVAFQVVLIQQSLATFSPHDNAYGSIYYCARRASTWRTPPSVCSRSPGCVTRSARLHAASVASPSTSSRCTGSSSSCRGARLPDARHRGPRMTAAPAAGRSVAASCGSGCSRRRSPGPLSSSSGYLVEEAGCGRPDSSSLGRRHRNAAAAVTIVASAVLAVAGGARQPRRCAGPRRRRPRRSPRFLATAGARRRADLPARDRPRRRRPRPAERLSAGMSERPTSPHRGCCSACARRGRGGLRYEPRPRRSPAPTRAAAPALIAAYGCGACHTISGVSDATGEIGPRLTASATGS